MWSKETGGVISCPKYFLPTYQPTGAALVVTVADFVISPTSGPTGTAVTLTGSNYPRSSAVKLTFVDFAGTITTLTSVTTNATGGFSTVRTVPPGAAVGNGKFTATSNLTAVKISQAFAVT
jgi:hypothetical protein